MEKSPMPHQMYNDRPAGAPWEKGITAQSFEELADIAINNLPQGESLSVVCGPLSTGGTKNHAYNIDIFIATISGLRESGLLMFDQTPYEYGLYRLACEWEKAGNTGYCFPILDVFYAKVFETRRITKGHFLPGWESSTGARWEREKLIGLGCQIEDLTMGEVRGFLCAIHHIGHVEKILHLLKTHV